MIYNIYDTVNRIKVGTISAEKLFVSGEKLSREIKKRFGGIKEFIATTAELTWTNLDGEWVMHRKNQDPLKMFDSKRSMDWLGLNNKIMEGEYE